MFTSDDLTDDAFLGGKLRVLQPRNGYRAGIDAVLLGATVPEAAARTSTLLDVGAGVGTAGLCALARVHDLQAVLLEREPVLAALAAENAQRNGLEDRCRVIEGDLDSITNDELTLKGAVPQSFDHVIANPPYHTEGGGTPAATRLKARSHAMADASLESWCRFLARMTKPSGTATVIHKAEALDEILSGFRARFGAVKVLPIHPRDGAGAIRVLVRGIKGSRAPTEILCGAVLHEEGNAFTAGAADVLRLGAGIDLDYWTGFRRKP